MSFSKIEKLTYEIANPIALELGYEIYDVIYVKEGPHWFLRVFIKSEAGVSIDDCEAVSRRLSTMLDDKNIIQTNYFLEVSSPGIERILRSDKHFEDAVGEEILLKFFKPIEGKKTLEGELVSADNASITIKTLTGEALIEKQNISKANVIYKL